VTETVTELVGHTGFEPVTSSGVNDRHARRSDQLTQATQGVHGGALAASYRDMDGYREVGVVTTIADLLREVLRMGDESGVRYVRRRHVPEETLADLAHRTHEYAFAAGRQGDPGDERIYEDGILPWWREEGGLSEQQAGRLFHLRSDVVDWLGERGLASRSNPRSTPLRVWRRSGVSPIMEINEWWLDDPAQKYWMEITGRDDIGNDLLAPQVSDAGRPEWGYELVRFVKPGDVVLHWSTGQGRRGLVAYSSVAGPPGTTTMVWQSRGTTGRTHTGPPTEEPAWTTPLADLKYLPSSITREQLQMHRTAVLDLQARLKEAYGGARLYLPFYDYGGRELRATQAYLVKFPAQLLTLLGLVTVPGASSAKEAIEPSRRTRRGSGYLPDVELKRAIERHAVRLAANLYESEGYAYEDVGATHSYDLRLERGPEEIHVEVKGSTGVADTVELTSNEVSHADSTGWETQLVVVDQISWDTNAGVIITAGGRLRRWRKWHAQPHRLTSTRYRYQLPSEDEPT